MPDEVMSIGDERLVRGAPDHPVPLPPEDRDYLLACLAAIERSFGLVAFPGLRFEAVPARALMRRLTQWWRGLEPQTEAQQAAHGQLPGAILLLDNACACLRERVEVGP
jgi:hypothetical protein